MLWNAIAGVLTWNRRAELLGRRLRLSYLQSPMSFLASTLFGERFLYVRWRDTIVDPGPVFARLDALQRTEPARAVLVTHFHEEHIGNAACVARAANAPVVASQRTLRAMRSPERLPFIRRWFGQPEPAGEGAVLLDAANATALLNELGLVAVESPGHCEGHLAFYDPAERVLFAGDAFLHPVFTSPNGDSDAIDWIATLERLAALDVRVLVGTHGRVISASDIGGGPLFVERRDPNEQIRAKLAFLRWSRDVVEEGLRRGLSLAVIEAALFSGARETWIPDQFARLLSGGAFSRSVFVRSLRGTSSSRLSRPLRPIRSVLHQGSLRRSH
jgi:hydroxyacylglutathione hydrolase